MKKNNCANHPNEWRGVIIYRVAEKTIPQALDLDEFYRN